MGKFVWGLIIGIGSPVIALLAPGMAQYHGGSVSGVGIIAVLGIIIGIILMFYSILFPSKTETYSCSDCKYEETYKK